MKVWRAKFSVIQKREIVDAMRNVGLLDLNKANAVDARIELDLRIGACFTRFQTLALQSKFEALADKVISYGTNILAHLIQALVSFLRWGLWWNSIRGGRILWLKRFGPLVLIL